MKNIFVIVAVVGVLFVPALTFAITFASIKERISLQEGYVEIGKENVYVFEDKQTNVTCYLAQAKYSYTQSISCVKN